MFGLGGPARPKAVAFDVIGTLFPLEPLRASIVALGLPPAGLEGWFAAGCRDAFAMAAVGDFAPFATVLDAALELVLAEQGLTASTHERRAVVKQLDALDAREHAREAMALLAEAGIALVALSNGAKSSTSKLLKRAALGNLVAEIVSVDDVKLAKPRAEVYRHAAERLGVRPEEMALVAAHPWDINGAAAAGLATAYLDADRPFSRTMRKPDLQGTTLLELARQILAL
ncbi:haloacid dehalogenase type II [Sphingomonas bacterium]|uniref:haloacid dehalogenase type II n=1 Tax=Sphingomonas bacterium TaxID=1895847 RepID=UPI001577789E|nr:haloacid dehalogenase type II [Sphingomonas bacterium]